MQTTPKWQGHIALLLANICWGMMSPISKAVMLGGEISPLALSALRIGGGAVLFLLCSLFLPASVAPQEHVKRRDLWKIACASILMISANQGLFIMGISYTSPIDSAVMSSLTPMLTMLLAALVLNIPITKLKAVGVFLGLGGVIMLVTSESSDANASNPLLGDAMCFVAQLCAALYYVLFRDIIMRYSAFTLMKWMFIMSAIIYVPCCFPALIEVDYTALPASTWWSLAYIIIFATCFAYLTLPFAQKILKPTVVSIYNYFQPLIAAAVAVWLGVGDFGLIKIGATALIFMGVYFVSNNSPGSRQPEKQAI